MDRPLSPVDDRLLAGILRQRGAIFVALNAVFAFLYSLGHEPIANVAGNSPLACFYFSIETLATVGYGDMHPQTNYGHLSPPSKSSPACAFSR